MNINNFLLELGLNKQQLAERLDWSPQSLSQSLKHRSTTFLFKFNTKFPDWKAIYTFRDEYDFQKVEPDPLPEAVTLHRMSKEMLLEDLAQYPEIYSFIAAIHQDTFAVSFDTPEGLNVQFSDLGSPKSYGKFPSGNLEDFANMLALKSKHHD
jgi:hypothetical protein